MAMTKVGMAIKIKAAMAGVTATPDTSDAYRTATLEAMCQGIIEEIVANSELVPITQDSGSAGAGIITGKVR